MNTLTSSAVRRIVIGGIASGALAAGLLTGVAAQTASAQPADPTVAAEGPKKCTGEACKKSEVTMTADQALAIIHNEYALGDGGGQLSKLVDDVMTLRARGFMPSNANKLAIQNALNDRPNQAPLVAALQQTLSYQRKLMAQNGAATQPGSGPTNKAPTWQPPRGDDDRNQFTDGWDINPYN
ncbi:hypothetical protein [Mycolicibacterium arseniciresistens]|jgi:hypothetical protein|uniref:Uncharacterized protein n=1 Tax=Mycolicibacterium arseniciresistens TaxID=3062257 RepID=A0ABT8UG37_9MYCO|nr:hypothetical protein [Mycolicibacterium arseniciresistens]MDO3636736.1 hypothetical protein [Mycolicibacterium arseniciresistens]